MLAKHHIEYTTEENIWLFGTVYKRGSLGTFNFKGDVRPSWTYVDK